jgi:CheY-like chemotaxis protein
LLQDSGAAVFSAGSADAADDLLGSEDIDLLVSDIGMPDRDGYDLIRAVRSSSRRSLREMPAAALTAFARTEDRAAALQAGFDAHITKPVDPAELFSVLGGLRSKDGTTQR